MFSLKFLKYYEHDEEILPPLKLDPCLSASGDHIFLSEPLVRIHVLFIFNFQVGIKCK